MASNSTITLRDLIEGALNALHQEVQRPLQVSIGSSALDTTVTTFTVSDASLITTPVILEHGQELMLCVGKSTATPPVLTVIRGYAGTPAQAGVTGDPVLINPMWSRYKIRNAILTCFRRTFAAKLPNLVTTQLVPVLNKAVIEMPSNTIDVNRVIYVDPWDGRPDEVTSWDFYDDVAGESSTGKLIRLNPRMITINAESTNIYVTYQVPYLWSGGSDSPTSESESISVPTGAEDLPTLYAAAYLLLNREMSRIQMDRSEQWITEAAVRGGISMRLVQQAWTNFYTALDEVRSTQNVPRPIRYRPRPRRY